MNFQATLDEALFKGANRGRPFEIRDSNEAGGLGGQAFDFAEVSGLICGDPDGAAGRKRSVKCAEKILRDDPTRAMASFRPWIRKHEMEDRDGTRGEQMSDSVRNFNLQDTGIVQSGYFDLAQCAPHATRHAFDSKEISGGTRRRARGQERSVAASKVDHQRCSIAVDGPKIKWRKIISRDDLRRMGYCRGSCRHVE